MDSQERTYRYDAANQLAGTAYSDGHTPGFTDACGADGQRVSMSDGTGTSTYQYDSLNRLISSRNGAGATVGYGYDRRVVGKVPAPMRREPITRAHATGVCSRRRCWPVMGGGAGLYG
jgi:hypothetical protein